jgi:hypothetical protein
MLPATAVILNEKWTAQPTPHLSPWQVSSLVQAPPSASPDSGLLSPKLHRLLIKNKRRRKKLRPQIYFGHEQLVSIARLWSGRGRRGMA